MVWFTTQVCGDTEPVVFKVVMVCMNLSFSIQYRSNWKVSIGYAAVSFHPNLTVAPTRIVSDPFWVQEISALPGWGIHPKVARQARAAIFEYLENIILPPLDFVVVGLVDVVVADDDGAGIVETI